MKKTKLSPEDVLNTQSLVFADVWVHAEKKHLLQNILPWIGRVLSIVTGLSVLSAVTQPDDWQYKAISAVMALGLAGTYLALHWSRKDQVKRSSRLIVAILAFDSLMLALLFGNLIIAYSIAGLSLALLTSVLISTKAGYSFALIFTLTGLVTYVLQEYKILSITLPTSSTQHDILNIAMYILSTLMGMYLIAMNQAGIHSALEQVISQANELKVTNKRLAHEIHERERAEARLAQLNMSLEAEVKKRMAEIVAEKEKSDAILRSAGDAISVTDMEMNIQYVNNAFTRVTGYTSEEIIGKPMYTLLAANMKHHEAISDTEELRSEGRQGEILARRKDGRTYDAELSIAPVHDVKGDPIGYVFSHQDITRLKDLDRARGRFITNVSHELRTPLTIIKLAAHFLKAEKVSPKAQEQLGVLEKQAAQLELLIQDILEMTVFDSGKAIAEWAPVAPGIVIKAAAAKCQAQIEENEISLTLPPTLDDLPPVTGDSARLTQALREVLENAILFSPRGGEVRLTAEPVENQQRQWLVIAIQDFGPGITEEEMPHLYDRFFRGRLAESGHTPGTGLGLSIADEIMRAHGGMIDAESEVNRGSRFTLWLPLSGQTINKDERSRMQEAGNAKSETGKR
ncbi:MAG: PAS domain S-box protein [Anaerolineae bacterium]|nr:PAS domain S-box protein [Anaerolineae bacterium]